MDGGFPKVTLLRTGPGEAGPVKQVEIDYLSAHEAIAVRAAFCRVYLVTKVGTESSADEFLYLPAKFVGIEGEVTKVEQACLKNVMKGANARPTPDETGLCYAIVRSDSGQKNTYVNFEEAEMPGS